MSFGSPHPRGHLAVAAHHGDQNASRQGIDWHFNESVLGLSMLSIAPGMNSLVRNPEQAPEEIVRAYFETLFIGVGAMFISKSWWPLLTPVVYIGFQYYWEHSNIKVTIGSSSFATRSFEYGTELK